MANDQYENEGGFTISEAQRGLPDLFSDSMLKDLMAAFEGMEHWRKLLLAQRLAPELSAALFRFRGIMVSPDVMEAHIRFLAYTHSLHAVGLVDDDGEVRHDNPERLAELHEIYGIDPLPH
jgi:hypothetical protein